MVARYTRAELLETAKQAVLELQQLEELKKKEDTEKAAKAKADAENVAKKTAPEKEESDYLCAGSNSEKGCWSERKVPGWVQKEIGQKRQ